MIPLRSALICVAVCYLGRLRAVQARTLTIPVAPSTLLPHLADLPSSLRRYMVQMVRQGEISPVSTLSTVSDIAGSHSDANCRRMAEYSRKEVWQSTKDRADGVQLSRGMISKIQIQSR